MALEAIDSRVPELDLWHGNFAGSLEFWREKERWLARRAKWDLSVSICRGMSSIVAVAFSEVHGLSRSLFIIWWLCQGPQACSRGTRHCRKTK